MFVGRSSCLPRLLFLLMALPLCLAACSATTERGYYAPVGSEFGDSLASWTDEQAGLRYAISCQGVYIDELAGIPRRTAHLQLQITRTSTGDVVLPIADMQVDLLFDAGDVDEGRARASVGLTVSEVWSGKQRVVESLLVPAWSRRNFDLFFDDLDDSLPIPAVLRFRWSSRHDGEQDLGDCQFRRIASDDPRLPNKLPSADYGFGLRNGYYMPGHGDLGERRLIDTVEARRHYVFHAPADSWIF